MLGAGGGSAEDASAGNLRPFHCHAKSFPQAWCSSIFQQRNLRHREVERLAWGCTAGRWSAVTDPGAGERDTHSVCLS